MLVILRSELNVADNSDQQTTKHSLLDIKAVLLPSLTRALPVPALIHRANFSALWTKWRQYLQL